MTDRGHSRRNFLQLTGAGLAATPWLAACAQAQASIPRQAIGRPWPNWGSLPETPPPPPKAGSIQHPISSIQYPVLQLAVGSPGIKHPPSDEASA